MDKFSVLTSGAVALEADNIDTDQIMPKQFLRGIDKAGLDKGTFYNLKHNPDGSLNTECVLNKPQAQGAAILFAGPNFGCGSSREHAVWGLMQSGFRVVAAAGFGEIFYSNCFNNGLLACKLAPEAIEEIFTVLRADPFAIFTVDLPKGTIACEGKVWQFAVAERHRNMLLEGLDMTGATLAEIGEIAAFRKEHEAKFPWMAGLPAKVKSVLEKETTPGF